MNGNDLYLHLELPLEFKEPPSVNFTTGCIKEIEFSTEDLLEPDWHAWLGSLGVRTKWGRVMTSGVGQKYDIHIDCMDPPGNHAALLNFMFEGDDSEMMWYSMLPGKEPHKYTNTRGAQVQGYRPEDCVEIYRSRPSKSCLVNTGIPHSMQNHNSPNRRCWSLYLHSIDMSRRIEFPEAREIFKPWIK